MRPLALTLTLICAAGASFGDAGDFNEHFVDATLRVDFVQFGNADVEHVSLQRLIRQGVWAGPLDGLDRDMGVGRYQIKLVDPESARILFERGFDSYFGEYRTTPAAAEGTHRAYENTALVPFPKSIVRLVIERRGTGTDAVTLLELKVDPNSILIASEPPAPGVVIIDPHEATDPHRTLDVVIVGEGYSQQEMATFRQEFNRFRTVLLGHEPFASNRERIAVRGVLLPSADSGVDEPTHGLYRSSSLGVTFNSLGSERYVLTERNRVLRDVAANVPYDTLIIMVNHERYGGGGIYNAYCTFTSRNAWSEYLLLHEFGHSFAGLADEYYTSDVAYDGFFSERTEPVEPNITALLNPAELKWRHLVSEDTPIPTPWNKQAFDEESTRRQQLRRDINQRLADAVRTGADSHEIAALEKQRDELAESTSNWTRDFLAAGPYAGEVGAFEGAGYAAKGLYRPMADCLMFRRGVQPFCPVCAEAVSAVIALYAP